MRRREEEKVELSLSVGNLYNVSHAYSVIYLSDSCFCNVLNGGCKILWFRKI